MHRPDFVLALYGLLPGNHPIAPGEQALDPNQVKAVLDFALAHGLTADQLTYLILHQATFSTVELLTNTLNLPDNEVRWIANNPSAAQGIGAFLQNYLGQEDVNTAAQVLLDYAVSHNVTNPLEASFLDYGADAFPCSICWEVAWSVEYALLKHDHPCASGDQVCDWELKAWATWNVISTGVHLILDGAGLIPVVGEIADLANGVIYGLEGNGTEATLSVLSAVPFIGWTSTGAKYARKIVNYAGRSIELRYLVRSSDNIIEFGVDMAQGRKQLQRVLNTPAGHEAHHIIPWEFRNHPVIQAAANVGSDQAFHMNELLNGISLPTTLGGLPKHLGSHPNYSARVEAALNDIETELGANLNPNNALDRLTNLATRIKNKIENTVGGTIDDVSGW